MTKISPGRNIVLITLLGLIILYALYHLAGGKIKNRYTSDMAIDARSSLLDEVDTARANQESEELDQIQNALDMTDLGTLPQ